MNLSRPSRFVPAAVWAAVIPLGCVSVEKHESVLGQLAVEQESAIEREKRKRELALLVTRLQRRADLAELERDEARARMAAAERLLAFKPPEAAQGRRPALAGTVRFSAGSDRLSEKDREKIAEIAAGLAGRNIEILVEGYSDATPIERTQKRFRSNMHISASRALAVYHELVARPGIDATRVVVVGHGEQVHDSGEGNALRRVDIRFRMASPPIPGDAP